MASDSPPAHAGRTAVIVDGYSTGTFLPPAFARLGIDVVHVHSTAEPMTTMLQPDLGVYRTGLTCPPDAFEQTAEALARLAPVAVLAGQEPGVPLADALGERLGLPGNGTALSTARRDKYEMIEALRRAGVRCADQYKSDDPQALADWAERNGSYPVVVKPLSSASTDHVYRCHDRAEVLAAARSVIGSTDIFDRPNTEALAQSFLHGTEYIVDTVSVDGERYVCGVWEYEKQILPGGRNIYDLDVLLAPDADPVPELIAYVDTVLEALGIRLGPAHAEVIMTPDGPALVEIGARLNGNMNPGFHDLCLGTNQADLTALAHADPEEFTRRYAGRVYSPRAAAAVHSTRNDRDGVVESVDREAVDRIAALPSVHLVGVKLTAGKRISPTADLLTSPLRIFLTAPELATIRADHTRIQDLKDAVYRVAGAGPRILLLGTDKYVMQACVRHGIPAVVVQGPGGYDHGLAEIPPELDRLFVDDQNSPEAILMALHRAGLGEHRFDAVHTSDEWGLVTAGVLAAHLGCRALDPATAVHFRDKSLQKRKVAEAGVPTARVTVVDDVHDVSGVPWEYDKAVLKPVAGAATARTAVVEGPEALAALSRRYRKDRTAQRTFVLEEYVGGEEWIADGYLHAGELRFLAVGRYGAPCLTMIDEQTPLWMRHFDPKSETWAYDRAEPVVRRCLEALGLRDGVFHMELFHDPETGRLTFSECAARRGGALLHEQVQAKFGVHLGEVALFSALGEEPRAEVDHRQGLFGTTYLKGRAGTLFSCPTPAELCELPGVEFARVEFPAGGTFLGDIDNTNHRMGQVLVSAADEDELAARFDEVRAWFDARLTVAPQNVTGRELRAWGRETRPDADFRDPLWH
ncbi:MULTISPECIES: ATP-grasp domain-containing protein [Streptomyces]|uniref:ATP-grasp domain-containing protein n=1 Tax=Streptomyces TaxID=1883 RepID=UPI00136A96B3|nr:ATP-grasp domain-containing protein [Streptomyces sp. SID5614]MZG01059.1 ATP-grasp domain-containing protein [Streptomyces sp. SID5614]